MSEKPDDELTLVGAEDELLVMFTCPDCGEWSEYRTGQDSPCRGDCGAIIRPYIGVHFTTGRPPAEATRQSSRTPPVSLIPGEDMGCPSCDYGLPTACTCEDRGEADRRLAERTENEAR